MMKAKYFGLSLSVTLLLILGLTAHTQHTRADEQDVKSGFTVEPIFSKTQIDKTKTYYYVKVKPGEKQTLKLKVLSTTDNASNATIQIQNAYTNRNGYLDYTSNSAEVDPSLKDSVKEIVRPSATSVTVKGSEQKEITLTITPPKEPFEGVKVGSIAIVNEFSKKNSGGVQSAVGYNVGIVLQEDDTIYNAGDELEIGRIVPKLFNQRKTLATLFRNPIPYILEDLTIKTSITKKDSSKVLVKQEKKAMRMAPHSNFEYLTYWGKDEIQAGDYTLHVRASSGDQTWEWDEDFEVTAEQAKEMNEKTTDKLQYPKHFFGWLGVVCVLTIATLIAKVQMKRKIKS